MRLDIEDLSVGYGDKAVVRSITFSLASGEVLAVLGANGAGKTTLFRSLLHFIQPLEGRVLLDGRDTGELSRRQLAARIAYVPQCHHCTFPYTVSDIVTMGLNPHISRFGEPTWKECGVVAETLDLLGIGPLGHRYYRNLSGGEKQLVLIARALVQKPKLMVMDEPTASLDFANAVTVLSQILRLKGSDMALMITSHSPRQARVYADRVLMLKDGGVYRLGGPELLVDEGVLHGLYGIDMDGIEDEKIREYIGRTA